MTSAELRYLIAVSELYDGKNGVKLIEIAEKIGVSKVSVFRAMQRLEKDGYVEKDEKSRVVLTEQGKSGLAEYLEIISFVRAYLEKHCGTPADAAYNDALGAACALSDVSRKGVAAKLKSEVFENGGLEK